MEKDEAPPSIEDTEVVTKYKLAGEIANRTLKTLLEKVVAGASVRGLCKQGDDQLLAETKAVFNRKVDGVPVEKGIAFPTCVSVNNIVCHFSPLVSDADVVLKDGDVVKLDLGAHIDGYLAVVGTTVVVGSSKDAVVTGRKADCVLAAYNALEAGVRLLRPGVKTSAITEAVSKIAEDFKVKPVEGMLSHQVLRYLINGEKAIIQNPTEDQKKQHKESEVAVNEVYALDVIMSTGEGKTRPSDARTTVYKRTESSYSLKLKTSRAFLSEVKERFTVMPFSLRLFEDEGKARAGVKECAEHSLVEPYVVLTERDGEFVVEFKALVMVMPNGNNRVTSGNFDPSTCRSEYSVTDEALKSLIATSLTKKKKKTVKKAGDAAAAAKDEEGEE